MSMYHEVILVWIQKVLENTSKILENNVNSCTKSTGKYWKYWKVLEKKVGTGKYWKNSAFSYPVLESTWFFIPLAKFYFLRQILFLHTHKLQIFRHLRSVNFKNFSDYDGQHKLIFLPVDMIECNMSVMPICEVI